MATQGFPAQEGADGLGRRGDGGQLFGVGVDAHGSVIKPGNPSGPSQYVADAQQADDVDAISQSDDGLPGGDNVAGGQSMPPKGDIHPHRV